MFINSLQICGICGGNHCFKECDVVQVVSHIPDKIILSRAQLSLPEELELRKMADDTYNVVTTFSLEKGTQFGPLQAKKLSSLLPSIAFPLRIFCKSLEDLAEYYLDTSDENECNWMMFVSPARDFQEQNMICYQDGEDIYYVTVKDLDEGEALKIWYSPYYASKMQKDVLKPAAVNVQSADVGDESIDTLVGKKKNITFREMWSCKFCGKLETSVSEFSLHLLKHYRAKLHKYCQKCDVSFKKVQAYQKHMINVHKTDVKKTTLKQGEVKTNSLQASEKKVAEVLSKENYFGDPLLNEVLTDSTDNTHLFVQDSDMNRLDLTGMENQGNLFENENLNLNVESVLLENVKVLDNFNFELFENENEQHVCDICLKSFRKLTAMMSHMDIHTGKYTCYHCKQVFARKENLNYHPCSLVYQYKCLHCSKPFGQKKYYSRHLKLYHNSESKAKPPPTAPKQSVFKCSDCPKTFTQKNNLITHSKCHNDIKEKYICPVCSYQFSSQKTYEKHYKLHEGHVFKCEICDKNFNRKDTLMHHQKHVHSDKREVCPICKKEIKTMRLLKIHMQLHEKSENFNCPQCTRTFKHKKNLSRHINKDHVIAKNLDSFLTKMDKPYACPKCDKKVKFEKSLKRHLKSVHPEYNGEYKIPQANKGKFKKQKVSRKQVDDFNMDLKQTIENMNFNTDVINQDITNEIDRLLSIPDNFGSESNDRLVESLINNAVRENDLENRNQHKDILLSMPDLGIDNL